MSISVIIPAYNEEKFLGETLKSIQRATEFLLKKDAVQTEIIVVDNDSSDSTFDIALAFGSRLVKEPRLNIARVRNAGARAAQGDVLVFIDADTIVPEELFWRINQLMANPACFGGAVDTDYRPAKTLLKIYLQSWRMIGKLAGMAQGATQFSRRDVYTSLLGYDESLYMGEDVDFYWRLKQFAKRHHARVCFIPDIQVIPSTRRFDQWSFWRTLVWTNPLFILIFRRRKGPWREWYSTITR